jgi:hypothetical protein
MTERYFRSELYHYLYEQAEDYSIGYSTPLLCLLAAINDYSFSDEMISSFPNFIPTEEEIKKYK